MSDHDIEAVAARWVRRNADRRFRFAVFAEFRMGDALPRTLIYDRLLFAIAFQRLVHAFRGETRRMVRWISSAKRP